MQAQNEELQWNMMASLQAQIAAALSQIQQATGVPVLQPTLPPFPATHFAPPVVPPISASPLAPRHQSPGAAASAAATPTGLVEGDGCQPTAVDASTQDENMCLSARSNESQDEVGSQAARKVGFRAATTLASKRRADTEVLKSGPRPSIGKKESPTP